LKILVIKHTGIFQNKGMNQIYAESGAGNCPKSLFDLQIFLFNYAPGQATIADYQICADRHNYYSRIAIYIKQIKASRVSYSGNKAEQFIFKADDNGGANENHPDKNYGRFSNMNVFKRKSS